MLSKISPLNNLTLPSAKSKFISIDRGTLSYNWFFRSSIDTPFAETNISQHFISTSLDISIKEKLPIRVSYFQRESNSKYFRDFRDVKVELNTGALQQIKQKQLRSYTDKALDKIRQPLLKPSLDISFSRKVGLDQWLKSPPVINQLVKSRERVAAASYPDYATKENDSSLIEAKKFIAFYDSMKVVSKQFKQQYDSLLNVYRTLEKRIRAIRSLVNGSLTEDQADKLKKELNGNDIKDKKLNRLLSNISSIRRMEAGRTNPDFGSLAVKNINVTGINAEYNRNNFIAGITAGTVSYRFRDFLYQGNSLKNPQYVVAAKLGYGRLSASNLVMTFYNGKKHLLFNNAAKGSAHVTGIGLSGQWKIGSAQYLYASVAHSAAPNLITLNATNSVKGFNFKDRSSRAYATGFRLYYSKLQLRTEGYYQYTGLNFQSFTAFRANATGVLWTLKANKYFFKRVLKVDLLFRKNDFYNSFYTERYKTNTIYKSFNLSFRKRNWPVLSAGYLPSSQLTVIGNQVYENYYQVLNVNFYHQYKIGMAGMRSGLSMNRLFNDAQDTSFIYYNATNIFFSHHIDFSLFSTDLNISHTANGLSRLTVMDLGFYTEKLQGNRVGFGVKVNNLSGDIPRVGFYGQGKLKWRHIGDISVWLEKNYLPGSSRTLYKNEFFNIGFTRYLN